MNEDFIFDILKNKDIAVDFLQQNDIENVLNAISRNKQLLMELKNIPKSFWIDALSMGLLVYTDYSFITDGNKQETFKYKYHQFCNKDGVYPALVYQKKRERFFY